MKKHLTESVDLAIDLACKGDFREAIEALDDHWPGVGIEPERAGADDIELARLLLACGILTVELGSLSSTPLQASAKDLLSKSVRLFGNDAGEALARYWLAIAYLRCGENSEALAVADSILSDQRASSEIVFLAGAVKGLALLHLGTKSESEQAFESVAVFLPAVPPMPRGRFLLNRGMLFRQTGRFDEALACYEEAIPAFRLAGSVRHQAAAHNNIAGVYTEQGRYPEALEVARAALAVFEKIGDLAHQAKVWDQIAQIHGMQEDFAGMEQCAARAVEILSTGDHDGWLVEALTTHGRALASLGMEQAKQSLEKALAICDHLTDHKQVWKIVQALKAAGKEVNSTLLPLEREVYKTVLAAHDGRITPAAHALGLHHGVFQKRLASAFPELLNQRRQKRIRRRSLFKKP